MSPENLTPRKLLLSCSEKKTLAPGLIPAIERYDGVMFRLIRCYLKQQLDDIDIYILSAEFGLIPHNEKIPFYDRPMTASRASEIKQEVINQSENLILNFVDLQRADFFINFGKFYFQAFEDVLNKLNSQATINLANGSSGKRLAQMHDWLYGGESPLRKQSQAANHECGKASLKGIEIELNASEIYSITKQRLADSDENAFKFQSWYVEIDGLKISPKWIVSLLTGLPVKNFHSDQARKVLQKLGVKVTRL